MAMDIDKLIRYKILYKQTEDEMKKLLPIMSLILIVAFTLSACAQQPTSVESKPVDVKALVLEKLEGEHTLEYVLKVKRTAEEWGVVIDRMIGYGVKINDQEKSLIIEWLLEQQK
jgi:hypothetical protein